MGRNESPFSGSGWWQNLQVSDGEVNTSTVIETSQGNVTLPDLSGLTQINDEDHDTKTCNTDSNRYNEGNCWNAGSSGIGAYLNSWNEWKISQRAMLINHLNYLDGQGNYSKGEEVALECYAWAVQALEDLEVYEGWTSNMKSKWNLENRCCVPRTGTQNFNNGVVPKQDSLKSSIQTFRDDMQAFVYGFQGVAPQDEGDGEDYNPNVGPGANEDNPAQDDGDLKKLLIGGGIFMLVITVLVIFARRKK